MRRLGAAPTWLLGALVALLGWRVGMATPYVGLDPSWHAGLAMAVKQGLQFGSEIVFSYGPLGFLHDQYLWFGDLGVAAFLYSAALYLALCTALVWALRRTLPVLPAVLVAFAISILPLLEQSVAVAVLVCLGALQHERTQRATNLLILGGAAFSASEALVKLSTGPLIGVIFLVTLIGLRVRWWQLLCFLGLTAGGLLLLWVSAGQDLAGIPDFLRNTWDVAVGYSAAMQHSGDVGVWKGTAATVLAMLLTVALIVACSRAKFPDDRARWCGVGVMAIAAIAVYKEGVVRLDTGHLSLYFSTACALWVAVPWPRERWPVVVAGAAAIAAMGLPARPPGAPTNLNVVANVRFAADQGQTLLSGSRREEQMTSGRRAMRAIYGLDPSMLARLRGHSVAIDPYEVGVAWAYGLDWKPLPVFQDYSAYTPRLDRLNAAVAAGPTAPERILRENPPFVYPEFPTPGIDGRFPGWDPPAQQRAVLCHYVPLLTTLRWQVLGRTTDRCSRPRPAGSVSAAPGQAVRVPAPSGDEVIFARIDGVELSGVERLEALLLRAPLRNTTVNGWQPNRLVPATARDGLILRASDRIAAAQPFAQVPQAETIEVTGFGGNVGFDFFRMRIRGGVAGGGD